MNYRLKIIDNNLCVVDEYDTIHNTLWFGDWLSPDGGYITMEELMATYVGDVKTASVTINGMLYQLAPVGRVE